MGIGRSNLSINENQRSLSTESFVEDNHSFEPICNSTNKVLQNQAKDFIKMRDGEANNWSGTMNEIPISLDKMMKIHQDNMELWQIISNLAKANQELSTIHSLTLNQVQKYFFSDFIKHHNGINYECAEKRKNTKASCSNTKAKENHKKTVGRARSGGKQNIYIKTMAKKIRRLKKPPVINEFINSKINNNDKDKEETEIDLRNEIKNLNLLKMESQAKNTRLTKDLRDQILVIEKLTKAFENSQRECEEKEKNLEQISEKLKELELKSANLHAKLETFQNEKSSATKMAEEKDQQSLILKARLMNQDEERNKQVEALEDANQQIRDLESTVEELTKEKFLQSVDARSSPSVALSNEEFKKELMLKREARQRAIAAISSEMERLKSELANEKLAHLETKNLLDSLKESHRKLISQSQAADSKVVKTDENTSDRLEALRLFDLLKLSDEITSNLWLQLERTDDLRFQLENDPEEHRLRINSLKRLSEETRKTLNYRKQQVNLLKDRLAQILVRLGDRNFLDESDEIKTETERQIEDITRSRNLCDERSRILVQLKDYSLKEIHELKLKLDNSKKDNQNLKEDLHKTENKMDVQDAEILNLESLLGLAKADCRDLQNQMSVINSLFTQMLLGASSAEMDLDRLTQLLQENHDLISDMAKENGSEAAALPKLLLDIIEQVDGRACGNEEKKEDDLQQENIAHNLPKVWRVLLELLRCHAVRTPESGLSSNASSESAPDSCYKSVDTPTGPRLVISVSKTYIRLKELILEKKHLEKEMNRMKQLNGHLETKLSEQEKRLSTVSDELSKTWNIVGRMEAQHQQLHTHEKILRYELQQKRKMLQELKQELEYCREKWESARQKNTNTEIEWRSLRREFAARKALVTHADSFNNSGESGFSDEREESDEDETEEDISKRMRPINSRRRQRKDSLRVMTPDTESEQATDSEILEVKLASTFEQLPLKSELENTGTVKEDKFSNTLISNAGESSDTTTFDPLDKALTNVIQKLIETDESKYVVGSSPNCSDSENTTVDSPIQESETKISIEKENGIDDNVATEVNNQVLKENIQSIAKMDSELIYPVSVFTIGPIPNQISKSKNNQFSNPCEMNSSSIPSENLAVVDTNESNNLLIGNEKSSKLSELSSIDSSSSHETATASLSNQEVENVSSLPSTTASLQTTKENLQEVTAINNCSSAEVLDERAIRLRNLEEQTKWLVNKVNETNRRGSALHSRLEVLHETYGSTPEAPPMPDILPTFRLETEVIDSENTETCNGTSNSEEKSSDGTLFS